MRTATDQLLSHRQPLRALADINGQLRDAVDERIALPGRSTRPRRHRGRILDVITATDRIIDLGPDGGVNGGLATFPRTVGDLLKTDTHTGAYWARRIVSLG